MNKGIIISTIIFAFVQIILSYSAEEDAKIIREFLRKEKPPKDHAKVARTLVHKSSWAATGTISTADPIQGFPMVNIISISDSAKHTPSTGNIYFLLTILDFTGQDIRENNKITFLISNDEDLSCTHNNHTDPMEPTCARVILSGKVIQLAPGTKEFEFGRNAFISRHPAAQNWLKAHKFFLCKLEIKNIFVLDWYGGPHNVSVEDYFKATPNEYLNFPGDDNEIPRKYDKELHIKINRKKFSAVKIEA